MIGMIGKTEKQFRRDLLLDTVTVMEILEDYEKDLSTYNTDSIEYEVSLKMHDRGTQKFRRNIELLTVLNKSEVGE